MQVLSKHRHGYTPLIHFLYPTKQKTLADILPLFLTKITNKNNSNLRFENKSQQEVSNLNDKMV